MGVVSMTQRKKILYGIFGIIVGLCIGALLRNYRTLEIVSMCNSMNSMKQKSALEIIGLQPSELPTNSQNTLVFVGVMTAKDFLQGRARAVYETWGKRVPGKIAFFSSQDSVAPDLPLVALKGVDDRYPPQKKSFMMLHYMYVHFIDRFEWFARADDDVYIRTDRLEKFLRSIDSSKPQFIGQAGRGNSEDFGLLSLEFDENFCMGGPGVIMSRETLRRVAPHIPTCLKNLYSTHEDVEVGRCVQKFAGIPCTWNYEMQSILHHNSSGNRAFSGILKSKEVHSAITLHPVKKPAFMYRLHAYMLGLQAQELRQESLLLHRDIAQMTELLQIPRINKNLAPGVPIFPEDESSTDYLGDHNVLGALPDLNRHRPRNLDEVVEWDFIAKSLYSGMHPNPKRRIESSLKEGLTDVIREIMEHINNFSRQRGRVIEFRELLYGYMRVNSLYGQDLILDLLLVYKKYRGKKMTVPVRRHLYIQRSFTEIRVREIVDGVVPSQAVTSGPRVSPNTDTTRPFTNATGLDRISHRVKSLFNGLERLTDTLASSGQQRSATGAGRHRDRIVLVIPLSGRSETFMRFLRNYEEVALRQDGATDLLVSMYVEPVETPMIVALLDNLRARYPTARINYLQLYGNFSRGVALDRAIKSPHCDPNDILFLIDVDMVFTVESLDRIRFNVIRHRQIYLPIVFSEYDPRAPSTILAPGWTSATTERPKPATEPADRPRNFSVPYRITNENGYFRQFGYGLVGIYKADLMRPDLKGFSTDINGWGLEDVKFLENVIALNQRGNQRLQAIADGRWDPFEPAANGPASSTVPPPPSEELAIFRAPDPSLVHIFHPIHCDTSLDEAQYKMCLGTKANTIGSYDMLHDRFIHSQPLLMFARRQSQSRGGG
ncbi:chondroitin sulfate synthase 1 isoform X1 [Anopheles arabiensis]|uniref:Hexosyltransferase n=1 Tax=Anopheles arabiensis TaxID=7173 RepID=A0A453YJK4_ANOAR|nr:chondroitin sulfate synthase 1 isoform X1 [Anopheles arabiensis]XP_040173507.1 chondroitin sulfate synthase 1 isoform X1 [Anopheles arabiensis]XP_040173508.1 chondroitin sulfate synthase 1 isoform X1 [Anopheles arabiensis]XP_040173509.1 chondroitin sulfate synthase 1 isoform X1 [Anopheles arabiensis]XP_040173510.1 chondroitin sulfate synthase 1 isoform X1 [Anopheles arabiensis]XP_040173511.1 chondroitin sulfate synthase 1 isoform X1 [Anopheles arabiensis]